MKGVGITDQLDELDDARVAEVAEIVLTKRLDVHDLNEAAVRLAALLSLREDEAKQLATEALASAESDADTAVELLRIGLAELAAETDETRAEVMAATNVAGKKQLVIGPEWLGFGVLMILGYLALKGAARQSDTETTIIETDRNGRLKVTHEKKVVFINPFSSLGKLVGRLVGLEDDIRSGD